MFGYIVVHKPELKFREFDRYQSFYCGLCRALKKQCGARGQLAVSYDCTFLAVLLSGLYEPECIEKKGRCIVHPFQKRNYLENPYFAYAAQMNLLFTYYKCVDDWQDERKLSRFLYEKCIAADVRAVEKQHPKKGAVMRENLMQIRQVECDRKKSGADTQDIDLLSAYFGEIMAEIFAVHEDEWEEYLRKAGYNLGKFIYLLDAYEDLERDEKKNCFNPLTLRAKEADFEEWIYQVLTMAAAGAAKEFEKLPIIVDAELLRNILYAGIWTRYRIVRERRTGKHE